ncbi:hypothetical protein [Actinomycetospora cinnamomea]|uniref:Uncharacterized protein n=1 Tax=Actinomycetospora cinnamomea TaxID=663609 RepID=A0A2U1FM15_9PSEU|nr:hypothetical protein [Actinomycetospora cinnamomea]PVZ13231.1 hypothetical protein C8D89_102381 [Actinomycetospora cinnamomea]
MRLLVVVGLTLTLLLGAVPLAVPGTPRLPGVPPAVSAALFVVAAVALVGGLLLLAHGRRLRRRAEASADAADASPPPAPAPATVVPGTTPGRGYVTVRTRW